MIHKCTRTGNYTRILEFIDSFDHSWSAIFYTYRYSKTLSDQTISGRQFRGNRTCKEWEFHSWGRRYVQLSVRVREWIQLGISIEPNQSKFSTMMLLWKIGLCVGCTYLVPFRLFFVGRLLDYDLGYWIRDRYVSDMLRGSWGLEELPYCLHRAPFLGNPRWPYLGCTYV